MPQSSTVVPYKRRLTAPERLFSRAPYAIVTMVARIKGDVSESMLRHAVAQVRQRHPNLRVRIAEDENHFPWFTSDGAQEIPVEIVPRESDDQWMTVHEEACRVPFDFHLRPPIRFLLVQSPAVSELIILCHHILCDGLSLAYLARDLMVHLGDPAREAEILSDPVLFDLDTVPEGISANPIVRFFARRISRKWKTEEVLFDQDDYRDLNEAYWQTFHHRMFSVELTEAETSGLVGRCRQEGVTVNSALTAAFAGAQREVQGNKPYHSRIGVAASLRDRLTEPAGEVMGFYAGMALPKFKYDLELGFWENARRLHGKLGPLYADKNLFKDPIVWFYLEPSLLESFNFKRLAGLVPPGASRYDKLSAFGRRDDAVADVLKRDKMDDPNRITTGTAMTNLTRLDFPTRYGDLELDRLILHPGGAFLATANVLLGAVTCAGKLSLVVEYVEEVLDTGTAEKIKNVAMAWLLGESKG